MSRSEDEPARTLLGALLAGPVTPELSGRASAALDLPERGRYAVVALPAGGCGGDWCTGPGADRFLRHPGPERDFAVAALGDVEPTLVARRLNEMNAGRGGVGPAVGSLAELSTGRRLAEVALLACPPDGTTVVALEQCLPAALLAVQPELADHLVMGVLGTLLTLPRTERDLLVGTLDTWLECGGSAGRAAAALYCHRNTVLNRLRRLERLTARSLSRPRELVELTLALDALRLTPSRR
ncbi:helix-turn-helix domain-containing protein [Streptomyces sp. NBC_00102]|uniref:helix-turn-helix domain-containing protein n=1 Tax=Streptomyces sp. NBC_00102 TaxID=2975652 RepID=UPI002254FF7C|nr:helix-turn-helix domain-containing protein [Streptomyces sp. NBC_00102]MCX5400880.1 helix-turn-helix domain-containing protein [Streptomyces sp. NBC_00102]